METFYKHMNNFIWQHPFIKGCIHFTSRFCPYMIIIFYSLFLLKIYIEWQSHLFFFIKNPLYSILIVIVLGISGLIASDYIIFDKNTKTNLVINNNNITVHGLL
mgnify:CR=1 FL=1